MAITKHMCLTPSHELRRKALFDLAHATPLCDKAPDGESLSEEERARVYESLTKLDYSIAAPARGPPEYMPPIQYFDVACNKWHQLDCQCVDYKDHPQVSTSCSPCKSGLYDFKLKYHINFGNF